MHYICDCPVCGPERVKGFQATGINIRRVSWAVDALGAFVVVSQDQAAWLLAMWTRRDELSDVEHALVVQHYPSGE